MGFAYYSRLVKIRHDLSENSGPATGPNPSPASDNRPLITGRDDQARLPISSAGLKHRPFGIKRPRAGVERHPLRRVGRRPDPLEAPRTATIAAKHPLSKLEQSQAPAWPEQRAPAGGSGVEYVNVSADHQDQRIDNFLLTQLKGVPRSFVYRVLRRGEVRLNGRRAKPTTRLSAGDTVRLPPLRRNGPKPEAPPPSGLRERLAAAVLYEDEGLILIDKPAGLAVHGGSGVSLGLIEALRATRPGQTLELVHRLDRETSGCLLISKRAAVLRWLHRQIREGAMRKGYLALLVGQLPRARLEVQAPLLKYQVRSGERLVRVDPRQGKPARTWFRARETFGCCTLAEVRLDTGRTHQIRVHSAHTGAAVAGDEKYGDTQANRYLSTRGLNRLFLHAAELGFRPRPDAEPLVLRSPLPAELQQVLDALRDHEAGRSPV